MKPHNKAHHDPAEEVTSMRLHRSTLEYFRHTADLLLRDIRKSEPHNALWDIVQTNDSSMLRLMCEVIQGHLNGKAK